MKLDKQILDLKSKYSELNQKLMNSENLDNKQIIQINKDLSKLQPIIELSDAIEKLENEIRGYKDILENENDEDLRDLAKSELPDFEKELEQNNKDLLVALLPKDEADEKMLFWRLERGLVEMRRLFLLETSIECMKDTLP
jgi:peptide chain release factor 1